MKTTFKILGGTIAVIALLVIVAVVRGDTYLFKGLWCCYLHGESTATIDDARYFQTHQVQAASKSDEWPLSSAYNKTDLPAKLNSFLIDNESVAFLVVKDDS